jgi:hypothetical protein
MEIKHQELEVSVESTIGNVDLTDIRFLGNDFFIAIGASRMRSTFMYQFFGFT